MNEISFSIDLQYKTHDIRNWMGENVQQGFKWRGGKNPETNGIWIWSEIFTHNCGNGDKIAIILMDTQGIFDHKSSSKDCTSIFSLGMLLSSVYCFNVSQNVEEDKLQFLDLCMNYARLAMKDSHKKVFQNLLFVVRDWQNSSDHGFGFSEDFVKDLLTQSDKQTPEMRELRVQIAKSIDDINAFLLPHPGKSVSQNQNFQGDLMSVNQNFVKQVETLGPSILAPHRLTVKQINGEKISVARFIQLLKTYVDLFGSDKLPTPKSLLMVS